MKHRFVLYKPGDCWGHGVGIEIDEDAIKQMLFSKWIVHDRTSHVGTDDGMTHYFKFKD